MAAQLACTPEVRLFVPHFETLESGTDQFGAWPFIYGTVLTSFLALLIAVPLGVGAAIYLVRAGAPELSNTLTFLVELLAAVPSVIYGLLAIFTLVPLMRDYIGPAIQDVLGFLPLFSGHILRRGLSDGGRDSGHHDLSVHHFRFARGAAGGAARTARSRAGAGRDQWESTWQAVLPFARLGILGSVFLALARALGETMAVTMVIGNDPAIHASLFAPGYTIAAVIANEFTEATGDIYLSALVELGLVLFALTIVINGLAQL